MLSSIPSSTPCGCGLISLRPRAEARSTRAGRSIASPFGGSEREGEVRVRDDGLLEVRLDAGAAAAVGRDELDLDARAVRRASPLDLVVVSSTTSGWLRFVSMRSSTAVAPGAPCPSCEMMTTGLPGRELPVEPGGADADALLPARLLQAVELRAVEELARRSSGSAPSRCRGRCPRRRRGTGPRRAR